MSDLEGIIDAIEAEAKTPSPSHNNLARLVGMALRRLSVPLDSIGGVIFTPAPTPPPQPPVDNAHIEAGSKRFVETTAGEGNPSTTLDDLPPAV